MSLENKRGRQSSSSSHNKNERPLPEHYKSSFVPAQWPQSGQKRLWRRISVSHSKKKTYEFNSVSLTSGRSKYKARTLTWAFTFFGQELFWGTSADVGACLDRRVLLGPHCDVMKNQEVPQTAAFRRSQPVHFSSERPWWRKIRGMRACFLRNNNNNNDESETILFLFSSLRSGICRKL